MRISEEKTSVSEKNLSARGKKSRITARGIFTGTGEEVTRKHGGASMATSAKKRWKARITWTSGVTSETVKIT